MDGGQRHHRAKWRLSPVGWLLTLVLVILAALVVIAPSGFAVIGLIVVIVVWAALLNSGSS